MTIRITIKNEDSRKEAIVQVQAQNPDGTPVSGGVDQPLGGGDSVEAYVHDGQQLCVKESKNG